MAGVFGCAGERDVYLFLCEVLRLEEGDALVERRAGDRGVLQDCDVGQWMAGRVETTPDVHETCGC